MENSEQKYFFELKQNKTQTKQENLIPVNEKLSYSTSAAGNGSPSNLKVKAP